MSGRRTLFSIVSFVVIISGSLTLRSAAQSPTPEGKEKSKDEEKKAEPKPVKPLEKPCAGKLVAMHAHSVCGPDNLWHVVEDDYYDCPPVQKFRVYDHATEQTCDKPPPDPIKDGFVQFNGSGCVDYKEIGPMSIYECYNGFWYLVTYQVSECSDGRRLVSFKDRQQTGKRCDESKPELTLPTLAFNQSPSHSRDTLAALIRGNKVRVSVIGTGETTGHVADVRIENLTGKPINCSLPPMILESRGGGKQDVGAPNGQKVALRAHESKTVPVDGVCLDRHKPPVEKGVGSDFVMNDPAGNVPFDEHSHLTRRNVDKLLRIAKSKQDAADKLEKEGLLKDMPYKDKKKRKEIVEQWSVWTDPRISEIEGGPPATKDDLKKVVEKQVGKVPPDEQKKIDQGIDKIFEKIELATEKAKGLEKAEGGNPPAGNTFNVDNQQNQVPVPQTKENPGKDGQSPQASPPPGKSDDGLPPPTVTDKQCGVLRNNLDALLAKYNKALKELSNADLKVYQLAEAGGEANQKIDEGYQDQSIQLIEDGRDEWKQIYKEWGPALRRYRLAYEEATKAHDELVNRRAAFQRMCPGVPAPEIPELPQKEKYELPDEYGE